MKPADRKNKFSTGFSLSTTAGLWPSTKSGEMSQHRARRSIGCWFVILHLFAGAAFAQTARTDKRKDHPDFRNPPRQYEEVTIDDRTFIVEAQLIREEPVLARKALARLKLNVDLALDILPKHSHEHVAKQQFWLMYGPKSTGGGRNNGLAYFRPGSPKFDERRDERWNSVVVVYDAANYASLTDLWALKSVLHELAHAYQLEQWPEKEPIILSAYDNAMAHNLYHKVKNNKGGVFDKAYATQNQLEYFAETSCMFFAACNYQPYNRLEFKQYDPAGYEMVRRQWKIGSEFGEPESRAWQLGRSRRKLEATMKSFDGNRVTLVESSGRERAVALRVLSDLDQEIVRRWFDK